MARKGLTAKELINATYECLKKKYFLQETKLGKDIFVEIADDTDWHRVRKGYMIYKSSAICKINGKFWLIFQGEETRGYPADPFAANLAAILIDFPRIKEEDYLSLVENSTYFRNSLIIARMNGDIEGNGENNLSVELINSIKPKFSSFIARGIKRDKNLYSLSDFQPVVRSPMLYKQNFVKFLGSAVVKALS